LAPVIYGNEQEEERAIFWEHEMNRAVRLGDWKLVSKGELLDGPYGKWNDYRLGEWELYNMKDDRSEMNDLAEEEPERVTEMARMWDEYAQRTGVFPAPWGE
jgi:arylsulfatase A-like enzyme